MPLSMTLNRLNNTPLVTPCFDGKDLHVDSELVSSGLTAISVKGYDAGDPKEEIRIRHRNSFWSVHRPELSKLNWATEHTPQNIENYLKLQATNQHSHTSEKSDVPPADDNKLTHAQIDEDLHVSKPRTIQLSDEDLESHTTLHKSRAEFCVTIGRLGEHSIFDTNDIEEFVEEASVPSTSKTFQNRIEENKLSCENDMEKIEELVFTPEENQAFSDLCDKHLENLGKKQMDGKLPDSSENTVTALMDDTAKYQQAQNHVSQV